MARITALDKLLWVGKALAWIAASSQAAEQQEKIARAAEKAAKPPDPMDGLADADELEQYRHGRGAFYLGQIHEDHGVDFDAGIHDDRGVFVVAGSGAGKGTSFYIQNCLRWPGPLVCVDPKGEAAMITAVRRGTEKAAHGTGTSVRPPFLGQQVAIIGAAPLAPLYDRALLSQGVQAQMHDSHQMIQAGLATAFARYKSET